MRIEKDRYVIYLDVKHFSPDELSVSVSDEFVLIHARHQDRQVRERLRAAAHFTAIPTMQHFSHVVTVSAGRPRLCVEGVSEEVQTSCWRDECWCHLQSVNRWSADNHCAKVISQHRAHYSNFLWRWISQTENVEQLLVFHFTTNPKCCLSVLYI